MTVLMLAAISLVSVLAQWLAWSLRVPAILFLLLTGLALGPVAGVLNPDAIMGDLLFPIVSLSVAIILFEGALGLHLSELKGIGRVVRNLCSIGMLATFGVIAVASHFLLGLAWQVALVLGAVLVVTGPTVIAPMLNVIRPTPEIDRILRWEGIVIDPIGALFAVLVFEAVALHSPDGVFLHSLQALGRTLGVGLGLGWLGGWLLAQLIRRDLLPAKLQKFASLAAVLGLFAISDFLSHESGLLSVTVMGLYLANRSDLDLEEILAFKEDLSVILISTLFILLAARLDMHQLWQLGPMVLALLLVVQLVARPLCILLSSWRSDLSWRARALLAWVAPRGIVAAAVGSAFAASLEQAKVPDADKLVPLVFAVIIATVVVQSLTASPLARWLKVQQPKASLVLIIGANHLARVIATALKEQNIPVLLADPVWDYYRQARMSGLPSYYGNPQSEQAERQLPLGSVRWVLALSPNRHQNALGVLHFAHMLGADKVFSLRVSEQGRANCESRTFRARQRLFAPDATYAKLTSQLALGAQVKATRLGDAFSWQDYQKTHPDALPLFVVTDKGRLRVMEVDGSAPPKAGETVLSLVAAKRETTA
ncbi:sodium:proton antiporter [Pseudaeromonas paramecii]|uniref:Sodium:proton antiporter n=1 Tax=Pseudaeromonas paramecii TaxID=2138166 RepID=A0ABP8QAL3_9GAMM